MEVKCKLLVNALAATMLTLSSAAAIAADRVDLHRQNIAQINAQYKAVASRLGMARSPGDRHAEMLALDVGSRLQVLSSTDDRSGARHYRYQQTFRGVPIFGEQVIVSEDSSGTVRTLFGRMVTGLASELPAVAPTLSKAAALAIAKRAGLGSRLSALRTENESNTQMIFVDDNDRAHMAYVVSYFADAPNGGSPTRPVVIVDAQSGRVLKQWDALAHAAVGTGPGGNGKTGQYEWGSGGRYGYLDVSQSGTTCTMSNADVKSVNLNGGSGTGTTAFAYSCPRNTVKTINGGYAPINDAHYFGGVIQNMYQAYTGAKALTFQLVMRVHYGSNYEGAFWNGTAMTFGDGGSTFYPVVSLDLAGHEVSHGYTEQHSNLAYSGQSGGINEAFSDIAGEAAEYYWKGSNDFLVSPEIFKATGALRYMANPPQDGLSIDNAANYTAGLDVHYSSGVYNKAFYLLANKLGWNTRTAFQVFARANALYWTPSSTFNSGACGVETAATDLGFAKADVSAAFSSVGVACASNGSIGGPLVRGVPVTNQWAATGTSVNYTLVVPTGSLNLTFTMAGGSGNADLYVKAGSAPTDTVYDCRPNLSGNAETCTIGVPVAGTYHVRLKANSAFAGVSLTGDYAQCGDCTPAPYTNTNDFAITDNATVNSPIIVSGRSGNAPSNTSITVRILHSYKGDLKVDLVAPDGSLYNIHNRTGASADDVIGTFVRNLSTEALNGTWRLRVNDNAAGDVGKIDSWSIAF